jgi:hypothetical protein
MIEILSMNPYAKNIRQLLKNQQVIIRTCAIISCTISRRNFTVRQGGGRRHTRGGMATDDNAA